MNDPWGSFQNFIGGFQQFARDPSQLFSKYGVKGNNPDEIIQNMMNSGQLSQANYNAARQAAMRIQGNPMFNMLMNGFKR